MNSITQQAKERFEQGQTLCRTIEPLDPDYSKKAETSLDDQFRTELLATLLYFAETAGGVTPARAVAISDILGFSYDAADLNELMKRLNLHGRNFQDLVPLVVQEAFLADQLNKGGKADRQNPMAEKMMEIIQDIAQAVWMQAGRDELEKMDIDLYALLLSSKLTSKRSKATLNAVDTLARSVDLSPENNPWLSLYGENQPGPQTPSESQPETRSAKEKKPAVQPAVEEKSLDELMNELNELTGLTSVKEDVHSLINLLKIRKIRRERSMKEMPVSMHLVFTGNPGTGKTTVARLLAGIYHALGALSKGQLVEVDRSELVGGYVGQTAIKTQEVIDSAQGGVLFIDEAYTLAAGKDSSDFGREAINTLLVEMENHRDDLAVIVAGYPEPMKEFLESNPGLKSRFNKFIDFPDYTPEELFAILEGQCHKNGYALSDGAKKKANDLFTDLYEHRNRDFANGRTVRNLFEKAVVAQANRLVAMDGELSNEQLETIKAQDFPDHDISQTDQEKTEKDSQSDDALPVPSDAGSVIDALKNSTGDSLFADPRELAQKLIEQTAAKKTILPAIPPLAALHEQDDPDSDAKDSPDLTAAPQSTETDDADSAAQEDQHD